MMNKMHSNLATFSGRMCFIICISFLASCANTVKIDSLTIKNTNLKYQACITEKPVAVKPVSNCNFQNQYCAQQYFTAKTHRLNCISRYGGPEFSYYYANKEN